MKKKILCACVCACILLCVCVLPSSAGEEYSFRAAVIVDSEDIAGFASSEGTLREFVSVMRENTLTASFYFDAENITESPDLAAALIYLKVNGFRIGIAANDIIDAQSFNYIIQYVTKSASRLVLCKEESLDSFKERGFSPVSDFHIVFSGDGDSELSVSDEGDTFVLFELYEGSFDDAQALSGLAAEKGAEVRGITEKTN